MLFRSMPAAAEPAPATDPKLHLRWLAVVVFALGLALAGWQVWRDRTPGLRHPATLSTAWVSFALWAGAVGLMIPAKPHEWTPIATRFRVAGWTWVLGLLMFVVHLGVAFHFGHGWSHDHALRHVQETAGWGPGLFVSYTFAVVWAADVVWLILSPASYATRRPWVGWAVHGFLAFVTFNGTVVYVPNAMRWVAAGVFAVLAGAMLWRALASRAPSGVGSNS